jgi:hypothetical protein
LKKSVGNILNALEIIVAEKILKEGHARKPLKAWCGPLCRAIAGQDTLIDTIHFN